MNFVGDALETVASDSFRLQDRGLSATWTCSSAHQVSPFIKRSLSSCGKADNTLQGFARAIWTPWLVSHVFPTPPLAWLCLALLILPKSTGHRRILNLITRWDGIPQRLVLFSCGSGEQVVGDVVAWAPFCPSGVLASCCAQIFSQHSGPWHTTSEPGAPFFFASRLLQMWSDFWSLIKLSSSQR